MLSGERERPEWPGRRLGMELTPLHREALAAAAGGHVRMAAGAPCCFEPTGSGHVGHRPDLEQPLVELWADGYLEIRDVMFSAAYVMPTGKGVQALGRRDRST